MQSGSEVAELAKYLGPALPVVLLLWRVLERERADRTQERQERIDIQREFTAALAKQTEVYAEMARTQITANMTSASAMKQLTDAINDHIKLHKEATGGH